MSCDITLGRKCPCKQSIGGIDKVYFLQSGTSYTLTAGLITAFPAATKFYEYKLSGDNGLEEPGVVDQDAGTSYHDQNLTITLQVQSAAMQSELRNMEKGLNKVIVKDNNGNLKLVGADNGCVISVTASTGTDMSGMNGYTVTITGKEKDMSYYVDAIAIKAADIVHGV